MARPSPASDAAIRDAYRRRRRRSLQAQEIAEDLEEETDPGYSTRALSRWNSGEDPTLAKISEASAMVSPRGFTAAASRGGRASVTQAVNEALSTKPTAGLPAAAQGMLERRKDRLRKDYESFMGDADEFSGRPRSKASALVPKVDKEEEQAKKAEKAVQRQGLSAEDYWERNPEAKREAVVSDWSSHPAVAAAIKTGNVSAIEAATRQARDDFRNNKSVAGFAGPTRRSVDVAGMASEYRANREKEIADAEAQAANRDRIVQTSRDNSRINEAERLAEQLEAKGIDQMPVKDGRPDLDRMRGMLSAATFQEWDDDKMLDRAGERLARSTKRELRYWDQAQDGRFGVGAQNAAMSRENQDRIAQLRADVEMGESRGTLSEPGGWRGLAERDLSNNAKRAATAQNIVDAANAKTLSYKELAEKFKTSIENIEKYIGDDGVFSPDELSLMLGELSAS
jgi:transposase